MTDDPKPVASMPGRQDVRAERDSSVLPEPESLRLRGGPSESSPTLRDRVSPNSMASRPTSQAVAARTPVVAGRAVVLSLQHQVVTMQHELLHAQQRLTRIQEERVEEADRVSGLLAEVNVMGARHREAEDALAKLSADLEQERETSAWLRAAGAQSTREVVESHARVEEDAAERTRISAESAVAAEEIARVRRELYVTSDELAAARRALVTASTPLLAAGDEAVELAEARAAAREAIEAAVELERELEVARAEAEARRRIVDDLQEMKSEADARARRLDDELVAAKAVGQRTVDQLRAEHADALARLTKEDQERVTALANEAARRILAMSAELSGAENAMIALRTERDLLTKSLEHAGARARMASGEVGRTTVMLSEVVRALEALAEGEEQTSRIREGTQAARATIADRTVALSVALSRAADATLPERDAPPCESLARRE